MLILPKNSFYIIYIYLYKKKKKEKIFIKKNIYNIRVIKYEDYKKKKTL